MGARVVVLQRRLTRYRVPLFERMRALLAERGVRLDVVVGDATPAEALRGDGGTLPWAIHVPCRYLLGGRLCWQPALPQLAGASLAIVTQENKLLLNHLLMLRRGRLPLAFWGHGRNFQAGDGRHAGEWVKRRLVRQCDWWFAYTERTREIVVAAGHPAARVTVLDNADDTETLRRDLACVERDGAAAWRRRLGIGDGTVALCLTSLHATKRLDVLVESARLAQARRPDLRLVVVGDGPDRDRIAEAARRHPWFRWLGARSGLDKAACLRLACAMVQPHGVGLVALDSLVAGVPLVALRDGGHGPEIAYLRDGENAVLVPGSGAQPVADALVALLDDDERRRRLAARAAADAQRYGIEPMARRFCDGIASALAACGPAPSAAAAFPAGEA